MSRNTSTTPAISPWALRIGAALSSMGSIGAVLRDEQRVVRQPDHHAIPQGSDGRVLHREPRLLIDDLEDRLHRLPGRLRLRPPGQGLGHRIQERDAAPGVGRDDRIADARQRDAQPLTLLMQRFVR